MESLRNEDFRFVLVGRRQLVLPTINNSQDDQLYLIRGPLDVTTLFEVFITGSHQKRRTVLILTLDPFQAVIVISDRPL